jgi:hypothetical protein
LALSKTGVEAAKSSAASVPDPAPIRRQVSAIVIVIALVLLRTITGLSQLKCQNPLMVAGARERN